MKKFFIGIAVLLVVAIVAVCTLDIGTGWIAQKGAEYVAETYNLGVSIGSAAGNPVKGYTLSDIELTRDDESLLKAGKISIDPALLKIIRGNIAIDWAELSDIKATVPHLLQLTEIFTGQSVALPDAIPLNDLVLNTVGGTLDGSIAEASLDIVLNGLPIKGAFKVDLADGVDITSGTLETSGGTVSVSGSVMPALALKASVNKIQISSLSAIIPQISSFAAKGLITADASVSGALNNPTVDATVAFDDGSAMGFPISASTTVAMKDMKIALNPLAVSALGIPAKGSVSADISGATPSVNINVKTDGPVTAATLRENLPALPAEFDGQVDALSVAVSGPVTGLSGNAEVKATKLTLAGQAITDTAFKAAFDSKGLVTVSGGSNIVGNPASLKGTVNVGGKETVADIAFSLKNFDLSMLPKIISAAPENIKGKVNAALTVKGKGSAITVGGKLDSTRVSLNDMNIDKISVPVTYANNTVTFKDASLVFMDLPITKVNGSITPGGDNIAFKEMTAVVAGGKVQLDSVLKFGANLNGTYDAKVTNIDLANVMKIYGAGSLGAAGKFNGSVKGEISDTDITGNGSLSVPSFTMLGLKFEQIKSSLKLSKMVASLPDMSCKFAGGTIGANASVDINAMSYSLKADLKNSQLKTIIDQMMPTLGGGLTGTLTGDYSASGKLSPFTLDGSGTVSSAGGKLYGFSQYKTIIDLLAKLHGNSDISYANAKIPFSTSLDKLTLKEGTVINAPSGDGIYQYVKAAGTIAYAGALNLNVNGSINAMLVNTAASTLSGAVSAGGAATLLTGGLGGIAGLATGAVTGATKSYGKDDFRVLSCAIGGTMDNVKFSNFKVDGKAWDAKSAQAENSKLLSGTSSSDLASTATENAKAKVESTINDLKNQLTGSKTSSSSSGKGTSSSSKNSSSSSSKDALKQGLNSLLKKKK